MRTSVRNRDPPGSSSNGSTSTPSRPSSSCIQVLPPQSQTFFLQLRLRTLYSRRRPRLCTQISAITINKPATTSRCPPPGPFASLRISVSTSPDHNSRQHHVFRQFISVSCPSSHSQTPPSALHQGHHVHPTSAPNSTPSAQSQTQTRHHQRSRSCPARPSSTSVYSPLSDLLLENTRLCSLRLLSCQFR